MRNPLYKRIKREFLHDLAKYIVIFLFLALPIALCSGYMISNDSMIKTYDEGAEKYNLEDGHFQTMFALTDGQIDRIEANENIEVKTLFYKEEKSLKDHAVRIYNAKDRTDVNKWCVHGGIMPATDTEIAIDRLYAENNKISLGDGYVVDGKNYTVSAFISLFDYSCLFKNNTDTMFNAQTFTVALVTDGAFNAISEDNLVYNYVWQFPERLNEQAAHTKNNEMRKNLNIFALAHGNMLNDYLAKEDNQSITFSINDIEGDLTFTLMFGILIVGGLAFVFALSIKSQIESEAGSIGTLKAMGYKNGELLRHYLLLPTLVTLLAGVVGNILAYTVLKTYLVGLYYHSYSLPVYTTFYNLNALIFTTVIPIALVLFINVFILLRSLKIPALNFLRGNLKKKKDKKVIKLSEKIPFMTRFRLRVIGQNKGTYIALFFGTFFACVILLFGLMMTPLLTHYKESVIASQLAPYQTVLKADIAVTDEGAEKLYYTQLSYEKDDIIIYGVEKYGEDSAYLKELSFDGGKAVINNSLHEKYKLKANDKIILSEKFDDKTYEFDISGVIKNDGSLIVFMSAESFKNTFSEGSYLVSYLSNEKLSVSDAYIYKTVTIDDLTSVSDQLADSMGDVFFLFTVFSVILFILLIYLLAKIVIDKNAKQISMMKILGYKTREINRAYNIPTGIMVIISVVINTLICQFLIRALWDAILKLRMRGWVSCYFAPYLFPIIMGLGIASYIVVYFIESRKISKIELSKTLKEGSF